VKTQDFTGMCKSTCNARYIWDKILWPYGNKYIFGNVFCL